MAGLSWFTYASATGVNVKLLTTDVCVGVKVEESVAVTVGVSVSEGVAEAVGV